MALFPSLDNLLGIGVTIGSFMLYGRYVFKLDVIRSRPISFIAFSCLILFMYLPLPTTLLDGNEMSHHLFHPQTTYILQLLYFVCGIIAFVLADRYKRKGRGITMMLKRMGFFTTPSILQLWVLGLIGWGFKYAMLSSQFSGDEIYQAGRGSLSLFASLIYAPLLIMFYPLIGGGPVNKNHKIIAFLYMLFMMIILVATNSRNQVIMPLMTVLICYVISLMYKRKITISSTKLVTSVLLVAVIAGPLSDLAFAMLVARDQRQNTKFTVLLETTLAIYSNKEALYHFKKLAERSQVEPNSYLSTDWNEYYVSSIFLNRVCNYRVADASIFHAQRAGLANQNMMDDFLARLMIVFPQPVVDFLFGHIDKSNYAYSLQDKLYAISGNSQVHAGYKVGGDVGINLSIFGYGAFIIVIIIYMLEFMLFDSLLYRRQGKVVFSFLTLISIYSTYFQRFAVGGGIIAHAPFLFWGFPSSLLVLLSVYYIVRILVPSADKFNVR